MFRICAVILLATGAAAIAPAQVTYSKEISRIFQAKCEQCHRDGDIAPFALDSYDSTLRRASSIQGSLAKRTMPPWKPKAGHCRFR